MSFDFRQRRELILSRRSNPSFQNWPVFPLIWVVALICPSSYRTNRSRSVLLAVTQKLDATGLPQQNPFLRSSTRRRWFQRSQKMVPFSRRNQLQLIRSPNRPRITSRHGKIMCSSPHFYQERNERSHCLSARTGSINFEGILYLFNLLILADWFYMNIYYYSYYILSCYVQILTASA